MVTRRRGGGPRVASGGDLGAAEPDCARHTGLQRRSGGDVLTVIAVWRDSNGAPAGFGREWVGQQSSGTSKGEQQLVPFHGHLEPFEVELLERPPRQQDLGHATPPRRAAVSILATTPRARGSANHRVVAPGHVQARAAASSSRRRRQRRRAGSEGGIQDPHLALRPPLRHLAPVEDWHREIQRQGQAVGLVAGDREAIVREGESHGRMGIRNLEARSVASEAAARSATSALTSGSSSTRSWSAGNDLSTRPRSTNARATSDHRFARRAERGPAHTSGERLRARRPLRLIRDSSRR